MVHIRKIANEVGLHKKEALEKKDDAKLMTDKKRASGAKKTGSCGVLKISKNWKNNNLCSQSNI